MNKSEIIFITLGSQFFNKLGKAGSQKYTERHIHKNEQVNYMFGVIAIES